MRIGELERLSGLSRHTLRFYEREGLLAAPARTASGYRTYDARHVEQLAFIAEARRLGFALREIASLSRQRPGPGGDPGAVLDVLGRRRAAIVAEVARLRTQLVELDAWIERFGATSTPAPRPGEADGA